MAFNPNQGDPGNLPDIAKPTVPVSGTGHGNTSTGRAIAYARLVLAQYCGYSGLWPVPNYGPWTWSGACSTALANTMAFFGLPASGVPSETGVGPNGESTWDIIDFLWNLNNP